MAMEPRTPPPQDAAGAPMHGPLWRAAVIGAVVIWLAFLLVPRQYVAFRALVLFAGADAVAVAAIVYGVRRYRPVAPSAWLLIAGGLTSVFVADVIYGVGEVTDTLSFPSPSDVFYLLSYPLYAFGLHVASKARLPDGDRSALLDAAIVTVTAGMFASLLIANVYVEDPTLGLVPTVVASAYPLADVLLVALAGKFLLSVKKRTPSLQLLALGLALTLAGDIVYSLGAFFTQPADTNAADTVLLAGVLSIGLAALHPSMTALTEEIELTAPLYSVTRVVGLYMVSMIPVAVLAAQALLADATHAWITIIALVIIVTLVAARFVEMAALTRRTNAREATLNHFSSTMLLRSRRQDLLDAAARAAAELVPDGHAKLVDHVPADLDGLFAAPVEVNGRVVVAVVADADRTTLRGTRDGLHSVARGLALALERDELLAEQAAAAAGLEAQNEQLREFDRMKDQLVSSVSHEVRTPLTSMLGYAELLLDEEEVGPLNADQRRFAEVIDRNCQRLNRLIDDILFVARVDAGRLSLERSWVDLTQVAAASVETARIRAQQGDVATELVAADGLPDVWADPTRMSQMFDNLISNAVKFTPPGGTVTVTVTGAQDRVRVEVADTGIGIPPDEVDRLFERFFRTSTVGTVAGTGLGLSIVKSIVEVHDGTIGVTSTEGAGTTIRIELPTRPSSDKQHGPPPTQEAA